MVTRLMSNPNKEGIPMTTEPLKDAYNNVLGSIETNPDGSQVLRDANGKIRGYYDPATDHTRGPDQRILAKGNLLATLIC
jgi:hypothetical protein